MNLPLYSMLVDVGDSEDEIPCLIPAGDEEEEEEVPTLVSSSGAANSSEDTIPDIPVTIITG